MNNIYLMCPGKNAEIRELVREFERHHIIVYTDTGELKDAQGEEIRAAHILACDLFLLFADRSVLTETDCYRDQLYYAQLKKKKTRLLLINDSNQDFELSDIERELLADADRQTCETVFTTADRWKTDLAEILKQLFLGKEKPEIPEAAGTASAHSGGDADYPAGQEFHHGYQAPASEAPGAAGPYDAHGTQHEHAAHSASTKKFLFCPACGHRIEADRKYCPFCGKWIDGSESRPLASGAAAPGSPAPGAAAPGSPAPGAAAPGAAGPHDNHHRRRSAADNTTLADRACRQSNWLLFSTKERENLALNAIGKGILLVGSVVVLAGLGYLVVKHAVKFTQAHTLLLVELTLLAILIVLIAGMIRMKRHMEAMEEALHSEIDKVRNIAESDAKTMEQQFQKILDTAVMQDTDGGYKRLLESVSQIEEKVGQNSTELTKLRAAVSSDKAAMGRNMQELRTIVENGALNLEAYTFISYCHATRPDPIPEMIAQLHRKGYMFWYDSNLTSGGHFDDEIAEHIQYSACFMMMIDRQYAQSDYCNDEFFYARNKHLSIIPIFLEETELSPGMEMRLGRIEQLHKSNFTDDNTFYEKLFQNSILKNLKNPQDSRKNRSAVSAHGS